VLASARVAGVPNTGPVTVAKPTAVKPLRRANLPATIAAEVCRRIARGELEPGARLPGHRDLAAQYDVSLGSVREAISMLVSAGVVETQMGRGTYIRATEARAPDSLLARPLTAEEVGELLEAHGLIELQIAKLAAERAAHTQIAALLETLSLLEHGASSAAAYLEAEDAFHLALGAAASNRYLQDASTSLRRLLRADMELVIEATIQRFGDLGVLVEAHRRLAEAVARRDRPAAARLVEEISARSRGFLLGLYALGAVPGL
jgi:DNA-binding FadR family transcriptional regulator